MILVKILISGGAGFIGSEFVRSAIEGKLDSFGISVSQLVILDSLTYAGNTNTLREVLKDNRVKFIEGDICNRDLVLSATRNMDVVINFAAESHVDRSINDGTKFVNTNVLGAFELLEASRKNRVKRFLQISTDEVYGSCLAGEFLETSDLKPSSPYSASKASADHLVLANNATYGQDIVITRSCNNFGKFQNEEKLIPNLIRRALSGNDLPIYGVGNQVREWINVTENVKAIAHVLIKGTSGQIYNIGSGIRKTNNEIAQSILTKIHNSSSKIKHVPDRLGHDFRYAINSNKLEELGFKPEGNFELDLLETIDWYQRQRN